MVYGHLNPSLFHQVKGVARFYKGRKKHVVTTQTEHKCVLDSCRALEQEGFEVTYLPVQKNGLVDMEELEVVCWGC
jgi:cysteine desulfurase